MSKTLSPRNEFAASLKTTTQLKLNSEDPNTEPLGAPRAWVSASPRQDDPEAVYRQLGGVRDPHAREAARKALSDPYWRKARWLIDRVRNEHDLERLLDVAAVLARLGQISIVPILYALREQPRTDQSWVLLKAIGWMSDFPTDFVEGFRNLVAQYLDSEDSDVREAAAVAWLALLDQVEEEGTG